MPKPLATSAANGIGLPGLPRPVFRLPGTPIANFGIGNWGTSMLNRLTVSALLKAVIALTSVCVVIALSLTAYASWDRLRTANRISEIADTSADLFKAMHSLRTDRA